MDKIGTQTQIISEDPHVIGFLALPQFSFEITFQPNWSGRIAATITGSPAALQAAFTDLQNDVPVGARSLIESIKEIRRKIFEVKNRGRRDG